MNEAERLFRDLLQYASNRRAEGVYDFTQILRCYSSQVLSGLSSTSAEKYARWIKDYELTDPKFQRKLDFGP